MKKRMTARLCAAVMAVSVLMTGMTAFAADETTQVAAEATAAVDTQVISAETANVIAVDSDYIRDIYNLMSTDANGDPLYYAQGLYDLDSEITSKFIEWVKSQAKYYDSDTGSYTNEYYFERSHRILDVPKTGYSKIVEDFGEANEYIYIPGGGLTGIGLGIYRTKGVEYNPNTKEKYVEQDYTVYYYGGFENGIRTGHGRFYSEYYGNDFLLFEGEWGNDAPNGLGSYVTVHRIQKLGDTVYRPEDESYIKSEVSGMLVNGLWNGIVSVKYDNNWSANYGYKKFGPSCSFEFTATNGIITDDKTAEFISKCEYDNAFFNLFCGSDAAVVKNGNYIVYWYGDDFLYSDGTKGICYAGDLKSVIHGPLTHGILGYADSYGQQQNISWAPCAGFRY